MTRNSNPLISGMIVALMAMAAGVALDAASPTLDVSGPGVSGGSGVWTITIMAGDDFGPITITASDTDSGQNLTLTADVSSGDSLGINKSPSTASSTTPNPATIQLSGDPLGDVTTTGDEVIVYDLTANDGVSTAVTGTLTINVVRRFNTLGLGAGAGQNGIDTGIRDGVVALGDVDNDGDLDLVLCGQAADATDRMRLFIYGSGKYTELASPLDALQLQYGAADFGDYDNDGDLDLVVIGAIDTTTTEIHIYLNDGTGTFTEQAVTGLVGAGSGQIRWGDINGDGQLDIVLTGLQGTALSASRNAGIFLRTGANAFTKLSDTESDFNDASGIVGGDIVLGDLDNDGDLDLVAIGMIGVSNGETRVYQNNINTTGTFDRITPTGATLPSFRGASLDLGDYDNDGDLDLLTCGALGSEQYTTLYRNDGGFSFTELSAFIGVGGEINLNSCAARFMDFDNDGDLDIILLGESSLSTSSTAAYIYRNDGSDTFTLVRNNMTLMVHCAARPGDIDNDGDVDIVAVGSNTLGITYQAYIFENQTTTANTRPAAPANLGLTMTTDGAIVFWDAPADTETASDGLSYSVRVGTTAGSDDVYAGNAVIGSINDGRRRVAYRGDIQQLQTELTGLTNGTTYYWAVQAIDSGFAAGPWSSEMSFQKTEPPASIAFGTTPPATVNAGASTTITVELLDGTGSLLPITGSRVTLTPSNGLISGASTVTATTSAGVATFNVSFTQARTLYLTAITSGPPSINSSNFTVIAGPASTLVFNPAPPSNVMAGEIWTAFTVEIQDAYGNTVDATDTITITPSAGTLNGTLSGAATAGSRAFTDISRPEALDFTLTASSGSLTNATALISVSPGAAAQLVFTSDPAGTYTAGQTWPAFTIEVRDSQGNLVTDAVTTVTVSGNGLTGTVSRDSVSGVVTFDDIAGTTAGTFTIDADSSGLTGDTSGSITINPDVKAKLGFAETPPAAVVASATWPALKIAVMDQYDNVITSATDTINLSLSGSYPVSLEGTLIHAAISGVATFDDLSFDTPSLVTINATATGLTGMTFSVSITKQDKGGGGCAIAESRSGTNRVPVTALFIALLATVIFPVYRRRRKCI